LKTRIGAAEVIRRHAGGTIGINTDHFRIPLLLLFCDFRAASGRFFMVFDLTFPEFSGINSLFFPFLEQVAHGISDSHLGAGL
jgi:hypothetical protein